MENFIWNIDPVALSVGPLQIRYYGLFFASAFLGGFYLMEWIYKQEGKDTAPLDTMLIYMVVGTVLGARLGHCLFYEPEYYLSRPLEILQFWKGGLASHGAGIGIFLSLYIYTKRHKENYLWLLSRMGLIVALAGFFIRTGNFFNSEIVGIPTNVPWAVVFELVDRFPRHPSQLYEAFAYGVIFLVLLVSYRKGCTAPNKLFGLFLIQVFVLRFLIEFTKEKQEAFDLGVPLSMGQLLSVPFIALGIWLWCQKPARLE